MKALKSPLARQLLADPQARNQLRSSLDAHSSQGAKQAASNNDVFIHVRGQDGQTLRVQARVVPKAA